MGQRSELAHSTVTRKEGSNGMSVLYGSESQVAYEERSATELILLVEKKTWLKHTGQCINMVLIGMT